MSIGRILDYKVVAKDVIVGHCGGAGIEYNEPLLAQGYCKQNQNLISRPKRQGWIM